MSRLWRTERRVGLGPDRLVLSDAILPAENGALEALRSRAEGRRTTVILSNHFVRYAVLPWAKGISTDQEWQAYAAHAFRAVHGNCASQWSILVSGCGRTSRVASAVDVALVDTLRSIPGVRSIQPYLMAAFNRARRAIGKSTAWFVVHEPRRLTLALLSEGEWRLVRNRQAQADWPASLPTLLDRETAAVGGDPSCDHAFVYAEDPVPERLGRYRITDVTLPAGSRACAMALP